MTRPTSSATMFLSAATCSYAASSATASTRSPGPASARTARARTRAEGEATTSAVGRPRTRSRVMFGPHSAPTCAVDSASASTADIGRWLCGSKPLVAESTAASGPSRGAIRRAVPAIAGEGTAITSSPARSIAPSSAPATRSAGCRSCSGKCRGCRRPRARAARTAASSVTSVEACPARATTWASAVPIVPLPTTTTSSGADAIESYAIPITPDGNDGIIRCHRRPPAPARSRSSPPPRRGTRPPPPARRDRPAGRGGCEPTAPPAPPRCGAARSGDRCARCG